MTRWDSPMFTVLYDDEVPPFDAIWEALMGSPGQKKVVRPNAATVLVRRYDFRYYAF
jgi:protein KTI12